MSKKVRKLIIFVVGWGIRFLLLIKVIYKEFLFILDILLISFFVDEVFVFGIEEIILIISERKKDIVKYFEINSNLENELILKNKLFLLKKV